MKSRPITILHVISSLKKGGTEQYLVSLLQNGSKKYRNIILYYYGDNMWKEELEDLGVRTYKADEGENRKNRNRIELLREIIRQEQVDIVYSYTYYNSAYVVVASFFSGVKRRLVHSHRSAYEERVSPLKVFISRLIISIFATDCLACNKESGESLFCGFRKFTIVRNGINLQAFNFDVRNRNKVRGELGVDRDCKLIGLVGRLDKNKNQKFALDCMFYLKEGNFKILLIGSGQEKNALLAYSIQKDVDDKVLFVGNTNEINRYYSAMDLLLMTSLREGLPFVLIEAQANGLPVVASSSIVHEAKINSNFQFMDLNDGAKRWARVIANHQLKRVKPNHKIDAYSIQKTVKMVEEIYEKAK